MGYYKSGKSALWHSKNGVAYDNIFEAKEKSVEWEQRERQNKLLEEQNRLLRERNSGNSYNYTKTYEPEYHEILSKRFGKKVSREEVEPITDTRFKIFMHSIFLGLLSIPLCVGMLEALLNVILLTLNITDNYATLEDGVVGKPVVAIWIIYIIYLYLKQKRLYNELKVKKTKKRQK